MKIFHRLETDEPMHCWKKKCKEELNGLHHCYLELDDFTFETWLCNEHFTKLKKNHKVHER